MDQLATQGGGFGPMGFGMPPADANNKKTYVYDIDHRSNQCIATIQLADLAGIKVSDVPLCPVSTGAQIASIGGGDVTGFDMYGQYITEGVLAAGSSDTCFMSVVDAPDDAEWVDVFGLPYRHASNAGLPADVTYAGPSGLNGRGSFIYGGTDDSVTLDYTVERENMFGDVRSLFASDPAIAAVEFAGTIADTGAIAITKTLVADSASTITLVFPDGTIVQEANGAGTVNHTLSPLYMSQYGRIAIGDQNLDGLVRASTENGTHIKVNLTGNLAPLTLPADPADEPAPDPDPSTLPEPYNFSTHAQANEWLDEFTTALGIGAPLDWANQSLNDKKVSAQALYDAHT